MKVRYKGFPNTEGPVAWSTANTPQKIAIVWNDGPLYWKKFEMVSDLIFIVPALTRRIENA